MSNDYNKIFDCARTIFHPKMNPKTQKRLLWGFVIDSLLLIGFALLQEVPLFNPTEYLGKILITLRIICLFYFIIVFCIFVHPKKSDSHEVTKSIVSELLHLGYSTTNSLTALRNEVRRKIQAEKEMSKKILVHRLKFY
jgi:preprotein translocase subunit SecG